MKLVDSWGWKSSVAGSTGVIFSFLRLNEGFNHVLAPHCVRPDGQTVQPEWLWRPEVWDVFVVYIWAQAIYLDGANQGLSHCTASLPHLSGAQRSMCCVLG